MSLLFETISIRDGFPENLEWHQQRLEKSIRALFKVRPSLKLAEILEIPSELRIGHYRCRVEYDTKFRNIFFKKCNSVKVRSLKLIEDNDITYDYKFADRSRLDLLFEQRRDCDDVLIVKNGCITDTSFANVIFRNGERWETPDTTLLFGTCQARLLAAGLISQTRITPADLIKYSEFRLINALRGMNDGEAIPVSSIQF
ncbi:MAG: aminotransferase class IV [Lentimicrobium sp.]|nr:aminotransferase class IV [Lentimicrobium sp.]